MKFEHRNVGFDVHPLTEEKWEWIAYPKIERGAKFSCLSGPTEADDKKSARLGIDEFLDGKEAAHRGGLTSSRGFAAVSLALSREAASRCCRRETPMPGSGIGQAGPQVRAYRTGCASSQLLT
jgi:hypothetical protein